MMTDRSPGSAGQGSPCRVISLSPVWGVLEKTLKTNISPPPLGPSQDYREDGSLLFSAIKGGKVVEVGAAESYDRVREPESRRGTRGGGGARYDASERARPSRGKLQ